LTCIQKAFDLTDKYKKSLDKVAELQNQFGVEDISDDSDEEGENNNDDELTEVLIAKDLLLSESGKCKSSFQHQNQCIQGHCCFKSLVHNSLKPV